MTEQKLIDAKILSVRISTLKEDIKVLSSPNCNGLFIEICEHYSQRPHQLSSNIIDEKVAHSFLKTIYSKKLVELEREFELL